MVRACAIGSPPPLEGPNHRPSSGREGQGSLLSSMSSVVRRAQIIHTQRTDAVLLNDRFFAGPAKMMNPRRQECPICRKLVTKAHFDGTKATYAHVPGLRDVGLRWQHVDCKRMRL